MSYEAYNTTVMVSRELAPRILHDDDEWMRNEELQRAPGLYAGSRGAALTVTLGTLALARAPEALALFTRYLVRNNGRWWAAEGRQSELLEGEALASALAATEALLSEWGSRPADMAAVLAECAWFRSCEHLDLARRIAEAASSPAASSIDDWKLAFHRDHEAQDLNVFALYAWLQSFAGLLRLARARGGVVIHISWH
jgi:hypothetical protein